MKRVNIFFAAVVLFTIATGCLADIPVYQDPNVNIEDRIEDLLSRMTLEEKAAILTGDSTGFDSKPNKRLGIPAFRMANGPVGVRSGPASVRSGELTTAFPASVCMAATWNPELVYRLGQALGREAKAIGKNVLLAPCVNIHRVPHGGRNFESFGEDPYLASKITASYVKGVQSEKVIATVKHFACNNQEFERNSIDVKVDERTLHEIYLPAFKAAVQEGGVWAVMSAYNRLNGHYSSSNTWLLTDILKKQWGFQGFIMSDWGAVNSTVPTLYAGLDLEMPRARYYTVDKVKEAVRRRRMKASKINDRVRPMLRAMFKMGYFDQTEIDSGACNTPEHQAIALQVAQEGIVLLKNHNNVLPIGNEVQSIAVIGTNAAKLAYGGGGSSRVYPFHTIAPLDALKSKVKNGCTIRYAPVTFSEDAFNTIPSQYLVPPDGYDQKQGLLGSYYGNPDLQGNPVKLKIDSVIDFTWSRRGPEGLEPNNFSIAWEGKLQAPETGMYAIGIGSDDGSRLYINGKRSIDNWEGRRFGLKYGYTTIELEKDKLVNIKIEYNQRRERAAIRLVWQKLDQTPLQKAVALAESSDMAILFLGSAMDDEAEGRDRMNLALPDDQVELILAVVEINPNTVVVLNGGAGILMNEWIDKVPALVFAWFSGQEGGDALANILLGNVNPSGKLVTTFPKRWEDCPAYGSYPGEDDQVQYTEGVFVGYRHFDTRGIAPLFPFGHGLSYTSFAYKDLALSKKKVREGESVIVHFTLKNTGDRDGAEVVQLYLADEKASVPRPVKELKGFQKVYLKGGEEKTVSLTIQPDDLKFFDVCTHDWMVGLGKFNVYIGSSSKDIRWKGSFTLE